MSTGSVTVLLNAGMDAFTNLFDVQLTFPQAISQLLTTNGDYGPYSVRALGFNPPELFLQTTQVDYKAVQLTRQLPKIQGDRTFTLEFRLDSNYNLYNDLLSWKHIWVDPSGESNVQAGSLGDNLQLLESVTTDVQAYGSITVVGYSNMTPLSGYSDATGTTSIGTSWSFYDVICSKVGTPNYQRAGSDAVTVTAEFIFGRFIEPNSNGGNLLTLDTISTIPSVGYTS